MAGYVLKHNRTRITESGTSYTTVTDLLTVASGHLYIIKGVRAWVNVITGGAITRMGINLLTTNSSGLLAVPVAPYLILSSAGAITSTQLVCNWTSAADPSSTTTLGSDSNSAIAVTDTKMYRFNFGGLRDTHMEAGQILQHYPGNISNNDTAAVTSNSTVLDFDISYIDYTL